MTVVQPIFEKHLPSPKFSDYIEFYYVLEIPMGSVESLYSPASTRNLLVLRTEDDMTFQINEGDITNCSYSSVTGLSNKPYLISTSAKTSKLFLVQFSPIGISSLFSQSGKDLVNTNMDLNSLISSVQKDDLCDLIQTSTSSQEKIQRVEFYLSQFIPSESHQYKLRTVQHSINIIKTSPNIKIKDLTNNLKTSERHLRRLFKEHVGVGPKEYLRITRFNNVFKRVLEHSQQNLYDYYDEPHFIKEFVRFSGYTPKSYPKGLVSTEHLLESIPIIL